MKRDLTVCRAIKVFLEEMGFGNNRGNAEVAENKGIAKRAIRKLMEGKNLKIDGSGQAKELRRMRDEGKAAALAG
jgi:hypothetical protein